jgi:hypothetical protein
MLTTSSLAGGLPVSVNRNVVGKGLVNVVEYFSIDAIDAIDNKRCLPSDSYEASIRSTNSVTAPLSSLMFTIHALNWSADGNASSLEDYSTPDIRPAKILTPPSTSCKLILRCVPPQPHPRWQLPRTRINIYIFVQV